MKDLREHHGLEKIGGKSWLEMVKYWEQLGKSWTRSWWNEVSKSVIRQVSKLGKNTKNHRDHPGIWPEKWGKKKGRSLWDICHRSKCKKKLPEKGPRSRVFFFFLFFVFLLFLLLEFTDAEMPRQFSKQFHSGPINMQNPSKITWKTALGEFLIFNVCVIGDGFM